MVKHQLVQFATQICLYTVFLHTIRSYEAEAVRQCLIDGKTECDAMSLDETLVIAETMDTILKQLGVKY